MRLVVNIFPKQDEGASVPSGKVTAKNAIYKR